MAELKSMMIQGPRLRCQEPEKNLEGQELKDPRGNIIYLPPLKGGLMDLRDGNHDDLLEFIMMHCFKTPLMRQSWDYDSKHECVSTFVTCYDEALVYLMIENNLLVWEEMCSRSVKAKQCEKQAKYTSNRGKNVGWNHEGIKRFNALVKCIKDQRQNGKGHEIEKKVLGNNTVNPRGDMDDERAGNTEIPEEVEAAFEIME